MTDGREPKSRRLLRWRNVLLGYVLLLGASHLVRRAGERGVRPAAGEAVRLVHAVEGDTLRPEEVPIVFRETGADRGGAAPVVLLHGSPGRKRDFARITPRLAGRRVLAVDLPGFGASRGGRLPDYSVRAQGRYVLQLLDALGVERAHVVGYSMGGGAALELAALAPERVASLTLLSSIGVQELELFGSYSLNHLVHGVQLALLLALHEGVPHFGVLDEALLSEAYGRNFFDTDQRSLRGILERWEGPMLILHGDADPLVPLAAAREHHRLVPQSRLEVLEGGHLLVFSAGDRIGDRIASFLDEVDSGRAPTRADASPDRLAAAAAPFDTSSLPPLTGVALALFLLVAALGTLVSEDLTCVGVGALVGQGRLGFAAGALACFAGIWVGDLLLYFAGRTWGRQALHRAPLRWVLDEERIARCSQWFVRRGPIVILLSRFTPGVRLPTYFAAGLLRTSFPRFALWFALAAGIWTPVLVWLSGRIGGELSERVAVLRGNLLLALGVTILAGILVVKVGVPLLHHRGRRLLVRRGRRLVRWEYWPRLAVYLPLAPVFLWLAVRHRGLTKFTAANPAIPDGGFVGESKSAILRGLGTAKGRVLPWLLLGPDERGEAARRRVETWQRGLPAPWPLVVKPDVGERGVGVFVVRNAEELGRALDATRGGAIVQEHAGGSEYGLFYVRRPGASRGTLFSITEKRLPRVTGDGRRTLERLILDHPRHVCLAPYFLGRHAGRLAEVPAAGKEVVIGELGTHCKGALFLDGGHLASPALAEAVDEVARGFAGFHFGRFDVRAVGPDALARGEFRILELNGVSSEATHVYDPRHSVWYAWRVLARQWALAFEIGAANARRGAKVTGTFALLGAVGRHGRRPPRPVVIP